MRNFFEATTDLPRPSVAQQRCVNWQPTFITAHPNHRWSWRVVRFIMMSRYGC